MKAVWLETGVPLSEGEVRDQGIHFERMSADPAIYEKPLFERGFTKQHVSLLKPGVPNFEQRCEKVRYEHCHEEDEVRLCLEGEGIFDVRSKDDQWIRIVCTSEDLLIIPKRRYHRFLLSDKQFIRHVLLSKQRGEDGQVVPLYRYPHKA
jgi:1,2-dihydroxy-3-keto-5-methylthiopentene dioxygenase